MLAVMTIGRENIKQWLGDWAEQNQVQLVDDTTDSTKGNYVQIIPWPKGKDPYNGWVHFEVIKRNGEWFAEFHAELSKNWGRDDLEGKLNEAYLKNENFQRNIVYDSYRANRYWKCRCPVMSESDLVKDLDLLKTFVDKSEIASSKCKSDDAKDEPRVSIKNILVSEILKWNLNIPDYQRGYCWERKNILNLFNDIHEWQNINVRQEDCYHIGTIVLKRKSKQTNEYDIIDGQQRLITLCIYNRIVGCKENIVLGQNNSTERAKYYLYHAKAITQELIETKRQRIDLDRLQMSVIVIGPDESEDLAFRFFNHLNALGKRLTDYDLLKSHHLRYVNERDAGKMANRWDGIEDVKVGLLHDSLYRIRMWLQNRIFVANADSIESHDLFHEFSSDFKRVDGLCTFSKEIHINSILMDGVEFFEYVNNFKKLYDNYLNIQCVKDLADYLKGHSNGTLWQGMHALSFMFYCKFGDIYLKEAIYAIAYRVSELRNYGSIRRDYLGKDKDLVFSKIAHTINRATHESEVIGILLNPNKSYQVTNDGRTAGWYWSALQNLARKKLKSELLDETPWNLIENL